jgi:hypothetical protein
LTSSEDFNSWTLIGGGSVTSNTSVSPDGFANADTIEPLGYARRLITMAGGSNTFSIYLKAKDTNCLVRIGFLGVGDISLIDTQETITTSQWKRMTITYTNAVAPLGVYFNIQSGDNDVFAWGAQVEAGSYVSSYIPTLGSSVTRLADAASKTGISSLIGQTEGTLFVEVSNCNDFASPEIALDDNTNDNRIVLDRSSLVDGGVWSIFSVSAGTPAISLGTLNANFGKFALAYSSAGYVLYRNGVQIATHSASLPVSLSAIRLNGRSSNDLFSSKSIIQAALYTTRLSNAELATLTAL